MQMNSTLHVFSTLNFVSMATDSLVVHMFLSLCFLTLGGPYRGELKKRWFCPAQSLLCMVLLTHCNIDWLAGNLSFVCIKLELKFIRIPNCPSERERGKRKEKRKETHNV